LDFVQADLDDRTKIIESVQKSFIYHVKQHDDVPKDSISHYMNMLSNASQNLISDSPTNRVS